MGKPFPVSTPKNPSMLETVAAPARPSALETMMGPPDPPPAADETSSTPPSLTGTVFRGSPKAPEHAESEAPKAPAADGLDRDLALARLQERMLGVEPEAVKIGRFVVLRKLGQGAMGIVYLAYDPKLDRRVALKLVDTSALGSEMGDAQIRLEREAQAAAALGHPNVVTVYDVGQQGEDVFLAMEYVEGSSLTDWMKEEHGWREVVEVFTEIAQGLAAAHAADLIHRDFKPDNVLMGKDGRPRVADFGLARPTQGWSAHDAAKMLRSDPSTRALMLRSDNAMASTGEVCGTPAYMAPEQFAGVDVTAASDQFGFCASMYEALFGYRPYKGQSVTELAVAVIENKREPLPTGHRVPKSVIDAVLRGLHPEVDKRHPSMHALAERLQGALRARTRNRVLAGGAFLAVLAGGFGAQAASALDEQPCEAAHHEIETEWNDGQRASVRRALSDAGLSPEATIEYLDTYAQAWTEQRVASCEATRVSGEQSDEVLSVRTACLDRLRARVGAATTSLTEAPAPAMLDALALALPDVGTCAEVQELMAMATTYDGDAEASLEAEARWTEASATMATLALRSHEPPSQWLPMAEALRDTGETHDLAQAAAYGYYWLGFGAQHEGDHPAAMEAYEAALPFAARSPDTRLLPNLLLKRAESQYQTQAFVDAEATATLGRAMTSRIRDASERGEMQTEFDATLAFVANERHEPERGASLAREALEREGSPAPVRERLHAALGSACRELGDMPCAFQHHGVALELAVSLPRIAPLELAGRFANVGLMYADAGDGKGAVEHLRKAADAVEKAFGPEHPMRGRILSDMGGIQGAMMDPEDGERDLLAGLAITEANHGEDHPELVEALVDLTTTQLRLGKLDDALRNGQRAARIVDAAFEPRHPDRARPRLALADALMAYGRFEDAARQLQEGLQCLQGPQTHPMQRAEFGFALARALAPTDPQAAGTAADQALGDIADFEPGQPLRDAINGWRSEVLGG
jgi:tetratricopeptide (TPR) repeat protein/predicted Ser/Thr protein kinase